MVMKGVKIPLFHQNYLELNWDRAVNVRLNQCLETHFQWVSFPFFEDEHICGLLLWQGSAGRSSCPGQPAIEDT